MMPQNQFMQGIGPRPQNAQPSVVEQPYDPSFEFAAQQNADELAAQQAIRQLLQEQAQHTLQQGANTGVEAGVGLGKQVVTNYLAGGAPTLSSAAVTAAQPAAAGATGASGSLLGSAGSTIGAISSVVAPVLGAAGLGYGAYSDINSGLKTGKMIRDAEQAGYDPERLERLRGEVSRQGTAKSNVGAASGALGGAAVGTAINPGIGTGVGALGGAVVGRIGGELQTIKANKGNLVAAAKERLKRPFG